MDEPRFLTTDAARRIRDSVGTPTFVYDRPTLERNARAALDFPNAFGLTVRYAMKANPNREILQTFTDLGLHIDASSGYEVERALRAGVAADQIMATCQEMPRNIVGLVERGVRFNACSLEQVRVFGAARRGGELSIRINPGLGSGGTKRTNVGGPASSFGIWHEYLGEIRELVDRFDLRVVGIHSHIGSGSDPAVWQKVAGMTLRYVADFPQLRTVNLGGGFKVGRMPGETSTDLQKVGGPIRDAFRRLGDDSGRKLHLEIEPGTFLVANAGALLTRVADIVDTGAEGYRFLKIDGGMTEVTRPAMYGSQHPLTVLPEDEAETATEEYIVSGHCCESGDILTPADGDPEALLPRRMRRARIGDLLVVDGAGAYCSSMSTKNYNSFPAAAEVMLEADGDIRLVRRRQALDALVAEECCEAIATGAAVS